jgi:hypothetical protein
MRKLIWPQQEQEKIEIFSIFCRSKRQERELNPECCKYLQKVDHFNIMQDMDKIREFIKDPTNNIYVLDPSSI